MVRIAYGGIFPEREIMCTGGDYRGRHIDI
jgi:hypothetical protein